MHRLILVLSLLSFGPLTGCGEPVEEAGGSGGAAGNGGSGGVEPIEPGPTCIAFCMKAVAMCNAFALTEDECGQACQGGLDAEYARAEECGVASEAVFECAGEQDCQGVARWRDQQPPDSYPCRDLVLNYDALVSNAVCLPGTGT